MKHICAVGANHLFCAGINNRGFGGDSDDTHYSFAMFCVDPEDFAKAIEELCLESSEYSINLRSKEIILQGGRSHDTIRITLDGTVIAITRGNLKVLYHGCVRALRGLPKAIRKAVQVRERKRDKELT